MRQLIALLHGSHCAVCLACAALMGCTKSDSATSSGISPQKFADAVHSVMMADRTVYATHVVTRLQKQKAPVGPSEYWEDEEHTIPLPAQMFRMGAEMVDKNASAGFTYALKSKWPLNKQNRAKTELEVKGIDALLKNPDKPYYETEELGGKKYFTAFYPDKAVAEACWNCHNDHPNREEEFPEFSEGDVMGAVIVRVPID